VRPRDEHLGLPIMASSVADDPLAALVRGWLTAETTRADDTASNHQDPTSGTNSSPGPGAASPTRGPVPAWPPSATREPPGDRVAVLVDGHTTSPETVDAVFRRLLGDTSVAVRRVYADWVELPVQAWSAVVRDLGVQPIHHVCSGHPHRAAAALSIDAVDLANQGAVDTMILVGQLGSTLPLIHRLRSVGIRVYAVGTPRTPPDVRAACDDFLDRRTLREASSAATGRHRA
jgi:NYN domain